MYNFADQRQTSLVLSYLILSPHASGLAKAVWSKESVTSDNFVSSTCLSHFYNMVAQACSHDDVRFSRRRSRNTRTLFKVSSAIRFTPFPLSKTKHKTSLKSKDREAYSPLSISHITKVLDRGRVKNCGPCYFLMDQVSVISFYSQLLKIYGISGKCYRSGSNDAQERRRIPGSNRLKERAD